MTKKKTTETRSKEELDYIAKHPTTTQKTLDEIEKTYTIHRQQTVDTDQTIAYIVKAKNKQEAMHKLRDGKEEESECINYEF